MRMLKSALFAVLVLGAGFYTTPARAVTVVNGSMTDTGNDYNSVNALVPSGWTGVPFTSPDIFDENTNFSAFGWGASADGGTFAHFLGLPDGGFSESEGISQDISGLIIGLDYVVSFEQSISSSRTGLQGSGGNMRVTFGEQALLSDFMANPGESSPGVGNVAGWQFQDLIFTATAETQQLTFQGFLDASELGRRVHIGLDGVSVSVVPTPSALWMLVLGLATLTLFRRGASPQKSSCSKIFSVSLNRS